MKWISVDDELPTAGVKVRLSYGLFGIRGAILDEWVSEGWITCAGNWSIKQTPSLNIKFGSLPTHWMELPEPPTQKKKETK